MQTVEAFFTKLVENEEISERCNELIAQKDKASLLAFLKENGVTEEDIKVVNEKVKQIAKNGELSDEALEQVAGGGIFLDVADLGLTIASKIFDPISIRILNGIVKLTS